MTRSTHLNSPQKTFLLFALLVLVLYTQLFFSDFLFNIDQNLIDSLGNIHSLMDYFNGIRTGTIYDIQPIRDISYFIDLEFKNTLGLNTFLLTNLTIWILCGLAVINIFHHLHPIKGINHVVVILIFLFHPLFTQSVPLLAARKHLLSLLFILWTILSILRDHSIGRRFRLKTSLLYLLSLLSHPIQILFPIWAALFYHLDRRLSVKNSLIKTSPLFIASLIIGLINIWWYFSVYEGMLGISRHDPTASFADILMAYGRYFSFVIIPTNYATFYGKQSLLNIVGLLLFPIGIYLSIKLNKKKDNILILSLFFLSLIPVTYKVFWFFVSDTYILLGSLCIFALIYLYLSGLQRFGSKKITLFLITIGFCFYFLSFKEASYFKSQAEMNRKSYHSDDNCINLNYYVQSLFIERKLKMAVKLGHHLIKRKCLWASKQDNSAMRDILAYTLIYSDSPDVGKRLATLEKIAVNNPYYQYGIGVFYLNNHRDAEALRVLDQILDTRLPIKKSDIFTESFMKFCSKNSESKSCKKLMNKVQ